MKKKHVPNHQPDINPDYPICYVYEAFSDCGVSSSHQPQDPQQKIPALPQELWPLEAWRGIWKIINYSSK